MKKKLFILILFVAFIACDKKKDKKSVLGSWNCQEQSDIRPIRKYQVNIVRDPVKKEFYKIYNFHNLGQGENDFVLCKENTDGNLIIDDYSVGGISVRKGLGIIEKDFSAITWTYSFTGKSAIENVKAKYY